ncbi:Ig-like domain-containing protein [Maribacter algicola]|uniref:Ig-like domain-containing protein n=1 Tax=Meishania litoralis TaxID=3434685 RepID=A0ACC7LJU2_9FLAO
MLRRIFSSLFILFIVLALYQCGRRGTPTGGPKDVDPPQLERTEPENMTTNFKAQRIRLYFDEYIKLVDIQDQLIVSPPLQYTPEISPQGGTSKFVEIKIKDTLKPNTTYTFNFGQSIVDNNEGNPASFLTYVFSTGDYIDSLTVSGVVKDAFNKKADEFISVMLYEIDSSYTDSTLYQKPPNYITNTLDSTVIFTLRNLKEGRYAMFAVKDEAKNNIFDQNADKIAFIPDTISLPTDSTYLLTLFKEIPDYKISVPSFAAKNKIVFGYYGDGKHIEIEPLTRLPDTIRSTVRKERDQDTLNYWFTPFETDSIVFTVINEREKIIDTFTVKSRKVGLDSLRLKPTQQGSLNFYDPFNIEATTPIAAIDTSKFSLMNKDSVPVNFKIFLDSVENQVMVDFPRAPNEIYKMQILPDAITDFFSKTNDTLSYSLSTKSLADYGNLQLTLNGAITYPIIVQLTDEKGTTIRESFAAEPQEFAFDALEPGKYQIRVIFDTNANEKWDTGNYLKKIQPERVSYYPDVIDMRPNWEFPVTFTLIE